MVRQVIKKLTKEARISLIKEKRTKREAARTKQDNKWKKLIRNSLKQKDEDVVKMKQVNEAKKKGDLSKRDKLLAELKDKKFKVYIDGPGFTAKRGRRRGATRASLRPESKRKSDNVTVECTIHLSKLLKKKTFHKRAPFAVKKIKAIVGKMMKTKDNRIDSSLNTYLWQNGVKGVPSRVRVRVQRKVRENTDDKKRKVLYTVISNVPVPSFKKLTTVFKDSTQNRDK